MNGDPLVPPTLGKYRLRVHGQITAVMPEGAPAA